MRFLVGFVSGALVGAVVAVLLAPSSGAELRNKLQTEAETELKKAEEGWRKATTELNQRLEETRQELKTFVEQSSAEGAEVETEPAT